MSAYAGAMTGTLYTFGYSGLRDGDDLRELLGDRAPLIYDVRLHVYSGNRAFSLTTRATVESAGYRYGHLAGLGNVAYKTGGIKLKRPWDIAILVDALRVGDVAIMCVCADATTCHRRTVAELARSLLPGLEVIDLQRADVGYTPIPADRLPSALVTVSARHRPSSR